MCTRAVLYSICRGGNCTAQTAKPICLLESRRKRALERCRSNHTCLFIRTTVSQQRNSNKSTTGPRPNDAVDGQTLPITSSDVGNRESLWIVAFNNRSAICALGFGIFSNSVYGPGVA
jgi:hypothetical protein